MGVHGGRRPCFWARGPHGAAQRGGADTPGPEHHTSPQGRGRSPCSCQSPERDTAELRGGGSAPAGTSQQPKLRSPHRQPAQTYREGDHVPTWKRGGGGQLRMAPHTCEAKTPQSRETVHVQNEEKLRRQSRRSGTKLSAKIQGRTRPSDEVRLSQKHTRN